MQHKLLGAALILLSAGLGSCGLLGGGDTDLNTEQAIPDPSAQSTPSASPELTVPPTSAQVALIRPTSPEERLQVVKSGRSDPFAELVAPALPDVPGQPSASGPSSNQAPQSIARLTPPDSGQRSLSNPGTKPTGQRLNPPSSKSGGSTPSGKIVLPTLPKPTPDLAQAVKVTGVMLIGGQPRAIVEAPNENRSRTVGIGDLLSNSQIRVKNINMSNPAAPIVVLEQAGMQVSIGVGQEPIALATKGKK